MQDADCVIYGNTESNLIVTSGPSPTKLTPIDVESIGLEDNPAQTPAKLYGRGKRKQLWKKVPVIAAVAGSTAFVSQSITPAKPLKAVKQEKP